MQSRTKKPLLLSGAALLGALALSLGGGLAAHAHVGIDGTSYEAGSSTLLTFSFSHGCDGSPTDGIAIQIPAGINAVTPTVKPGWEVEKITENLETPIQDSHGNEVTERVSEVRYTAQEPIADGLRETFVLSLKLPEDAASTTIAFPTVQSCVEGEHAWVQLAAAGQDPHDLDSPAPTVAVVAATASDSADQDPLVVTSMIVGSLGLLLAAVSLLVRGRKQA